MAPFVQIGKESTPLLGKAAHRVNPYRVTVFHQLVEHLADCVERISDQPSMEVMWSSVHAVG